MYDDFKKIQDKYCDVKLENFIYFTTSIPGVIPITTNSLDLTDTKFSFSCEYKTKDTRDPDVYPYMAHIFTSEVPHKFNNLPFYYCSINFLNRSFALDIDKLISSRRIYDEYAFTSKEKLIDFAIAKIIECMSDKDIKKYSKT